MKVVVINAVTNYNRLKVELQLTRYMCWGVCVRLSVRLSVTPVSLTRI